MVGEVGAFEELIQEMGLSIGREPADDVGQSLVFKATDGTLVKAVDGTPALMALRSRVRRNEKRMIRAVRQVVDIVKSQAAQIDDLTGKPKRPATAPQGTVTADEFFSKALTAQAAGKITGLDISRAEAALNNGQTVPADIVRRVFDCAAD